MLFAKDLEGKINKLLPQAKIHFLINEESKVLEQIKDGDAHLALITGDAPKNLKSKVLSKVSFLTCASVKHPLVKKFGQKKSIDVSELLEHPFVSPSSSILGRITKSASTDGWRDDKFERDIKYKVSSLKLMENLIQSGYALGYLPDYFVKDTKLVPLKIVGCPYSCKHSVRLVMKDSNDLGWLSNLWSSL